MNLSSQKVVNLQTFSTISYNTAIGFMGALLIYLPTNLTIKINHSWKNIGKYIYIYIIPIGFFMGKNLRNPSPNAASMRPVQERRSRFQDPVMGF